MQTLRSGELARAESTRTSMPWVAAVHATRALMLDAENARARAVIVDPANPTPPPNAVGQSLTSCLLLARDGLLPEAISALLYAYDVRPDLAWIPWCIPWIEALDPGELPVRTIHYRLAAWMRDFPNVVRHHEAERAALRRAFPLIDALSEPLSDDAVFWAFASAIARKAADEPRAMRYAERTLALGETYDALITVANVHRLARRTDDAIATLRRAAEVDPSQRDLMERDIALALEEGGRYREALEAQVALSDRMGSAFDDAKLRWRLGLDVPDAWRAFFATLPVDLTLDEVYEVGFEAYRGFLPEPADATVNVLRTPDLGEDPQVCVTDVEVPSVWLAFRMAKPKQTRPIDVLGTADFTLVHPRPGGTRLFDYRFEPTDDGNARLLACAPLAPPPSDACYAAVGALARSWFLLSRWWRAAREPAARIERDELLAALVHPPPPPEGMAPWVWIPRWQLAATLILAHRPDGLEALTGVALGTPDWTVNAAVIALTELGLERPADLRHVRGVMLALIGQPAAALRSTGATLRRCALRLPDWTPGQRALFEPDEEEGAS